MLAISLVRGAGFKPGEPLVPEELARRHLGPAALREAPSWSLCDEAALIRVGTEWRIYLRPGLSPQRARFALLHELAHWAEPTASEVLCNQTAGAILLPRPAFLGAVRGRRMVTVARSFGTDETCAWLRYGETTGAPLAVVTPKAVRVRGATHNWPAESVMRELAAQHRIPGLRKSKLFDAPDRTVLRAG
jgi:hypothetical protein